MDKPQKAKQFGFLWFNRTTMNAMIKFQRSLLCQNGPIVVCRFPSFNGDGDGLTGLTEPAYAAKWHFSKKHNLWLLGCSFLQIITLNYSCFNSPQNINKPRSPFFGFSSMFEHPTSYTYKKPSPPRFNKRTKQKAIIPLIN